MSGITVSDEILSLYEDIKLRKKHKYVKFSLKAGAAAGSKTSFEWSIDHKADPASDNKAAFEEMVSGLAAEPCFIVFDFHDTKADGRQIAKLVLIKWCPDAVSFRLKPVYGSTYQTLKDKLTGLGKDIQAADTADVAYDTIKAAL